MTLLERISIISKPGESVPHSRAGYSIDHDGTVYTLTKPYLHGVLLACIHPELVQINNLDSYNHQLTLRPDLDKNQDMKFESLPFITRLHHKVLMVGNSFAGVVLTHYCKPDAVQIESLRAVFKAIGLRPNDVVITSNRDIQVSKIWDYLANYESES